MSIDTIAVPDVDKAALSEIEERVMTRTTLADLIRKGSADTVQSIGWGSEYAGSACALSAAVREAGRAGII